MKRLCVAVMACVVAGTLVSSYGQCDDAFDNVLCVYPHPDGDGAVRDIRNGQIESFWGDWGSKDYVSMIPPGDCYPGRCGFVGGASDASIDIKALANGYGLYILSVVSDNTWVDRANQGDWGADAIDFYFDALDANTIYTCTDCHYGGYCALCTYYTQQFQVWMGATGVPGDCQYQYYSDDDWAQVTRNPTWNELESEYGILVDVISVSATQKAQEWFFPWASYGKRHSIPVGTLLDGKRVGFSGGYNDKDGDNVEPDCLRWRVTDPWDGTRNSWGDFLIQSGVGTVIDPVSVKKPQSGLAAARSVKTPAEYYTLQGKRIGSGDLRGAAARAVLVNRASDARANVTVLGR